MAFRIGKKYRYKILGVILYLVFSLAGLSILFIFPPRKLLFTENENDKIKLKLFKDFAKMTYENIDKPLIQNMTLTQENEPCEEGFEELIIKNQYNGNFSKFYGNVSFCIKRFDNTNYHYEQLLLKLMTKEECESENKKLCGRLNRNIEDKFLCFDKDKDCPLNEFDFDGSKIKEKKYPLPNEVSFFIPYFNRNVDYPVIVDMEIINNSRFCLERHNTEKKLDCEFPDNNQCFIYVGFNEMLNQVLSDNLKFSPSNLAKWNLKNDDNIEHDFCNNNIAFYFLTISYFNFTYEKLQEFKIEFPPEDEKNNSLYKYYEAYKYKNNFDVFFYLISCILLVWSFAHFILQIWVYCEIQKIRKYYIINGIILFLVKLISLFGMIIYHFWYFLKIEKVYIILEDEPLKQLLKEYTSTRKLFIAKMIIVWICGFIMICADLIILFFSIFSKWGTNLISNPKIIREDGDTITNSSNIEKIDDNIEDIESIKQYLKTSSIHAAETFTNNPINNKNNNDKVEIKNEGSNNSPPPDNPYFNSEEINLNFVCKNDIGNIYPIKAKMNENFNLVIERLKNSYSELKEKNMKVFSYDSNIINKEKTIEENGLTNNLKIVIV